MEKITFSKKVKVEQPSDEETLSDLLDLVESIGHDDIPFYLDWSDGCNPLFKNYLVETYGEDIKKYDEFLLLCC